MWQDPAGNRAVAAVADGLGSKPLSHFGSAAACDAAVASLAGQAEWTQDALLRAFEAAHAAIQAAATERNLAASELATTLQIATLADGRVLAAMLGDGAVVAGGLSAAAPGAGPQVVLAPAEAEYSNEVVPLTYSGWKAHVRYAEQDGAQWLMVFTDGLTRLLLSKSRLGWQPFQPFFDAFVPKLHTSAFDADIVVKFLASKNVDSSWDDDKCLVVMARDAASV